MASTFNTKSVNEIVDDIILTIVTEVPDITDINPGSVIRTLTEAVSTEIELVYVELDDVYQGTRIATSTGSDLDNLAAIVGLTRKPGTFTSGNISFIRNATAISDFTIATGSIVATQPNTGETQYRFLVNADTVFSASIAGETHEYLDGITDYPLTERFIDSITSLTGTVLTLPFTFTEGVDFEIVKGFDGNIVDTSTIVPYDDMEVAVTEDGWFGNISTLDSTDATTGWAASSEGTITLNTTPGDQKEGTACLNLTKASGVATNVTYEKTLGFVTDFSGAGNDVFVWYYIDVKADLNVASAVEMRFGNDSSNFYYKTFGTADLSDGWNLLYFNTATATGQTGTPVATTCDYVAVKVTYLNATIVKATNQQRLDFWRVAYTPIEDAADKKQGSKSLRFTKLNTASTTITYDKIAPSVVNTLEGDLVFWMKIIDATALSKIANIEVTFGSSGSATNSYKKTFSNAQLATGWNQYVFDPKGSDITVSGIPAAGAINYMRIRIITNLAANTLASGDLKFDYLFFATSDRYIGDLVRWITTGTVPDTTTDFSVDYKPLSKEVLCTAEAVGAAYNVGRNKVIFKVSIIANVDNVNNYDPLTGGTDEETDDELRLRVQSAAQASGKATVEALRQAVLAVNGVVSVAIEDMPLKSASAEVHQYSSFTADYTLDNEVVVDDVTLALSGTVSSLPYNFVNGTDYILVDNKTVRFQIGGNNPDNGTNFFSSYTYNWLGHVEIFVSGTTTPLPIDIQTNITTAIDDTRAAGVVVQWFEPTVVAVNVTCLVSPASGYTFGQIQDPVTTAIEAYLNSAAPGQDIYIAELYNRIQAVTGVLNSSITIPATDTVINSNQVAKAGIITVGSL